MKIEELEKLKDLLSAYKTEKCKEYKNDNHYNIYLDMPCSDCQAKRLIFSHGDDLIGWECMAGAFIKNIEREIRHVEIQESEDGD